MLEFSILRILIFLLIPFLVSAILCGNISNGFCDDTNLTPGDGCDASCVVEAGFTCPPSGPCTTICGDGLKKGSEVCDDGNTVSGDGCSSTCLLEANAHCDSSTPNKCDICGNSKRLPPEACDVIDGKGCASNCMSVLPEWTCSLKLKSSTWNTTTH